MLMAKIDESDQVKEGIAVEQLMLELLKNFDEQSKVVVKHSITEGYSVKIGKVLLWKD